MKIQTFRIASATLIFFLLLGLPKLVEAQMSNAILRAVNRVVSLDKNRR